MEITNRRRFQQRIGSAFCTEGLEQRMLLSTYDAAGGFSPAANPNGAWSYGVMQTLGSALSLYTYSYTSGAGEARWSAQDPTQSPPWVAENLTGASITDGTHVAPVGVLDMHPGKDGQYTDARLTLPSGGPLKVTFTFGGLDTYGTTTDVHVLLDGKSLAAGNINGYGNTFSDTVTANAKAGDTLDFAVGYGNGSYLYDSTSLTAQITAGGDLSVIAQPGNTAVKDTIDPVKVAVLDSTGSIDTTATTAITVAIAPTSTGKGKLTGTTTQNAVAGVATFNNLAIDDAGQYSLTFTDAGGDTTASGLFQITGGKLVFLPPGPTDGTEGEPLKSFTVALEDSKNKVITTDSSSVVTLTPTALHTSSTGISGNVVTLVNGRATFSNLTLKSPDLYFLTADDGGDTTAVSKRFKVQGQTLKFIKQPAGGPLNTPVALTVEVLDSHGKVVTDAAGVISLGLNVITAKVAGALLGNTVATLVGGRAIFTTTAGPRIDAVGTYTLTATDEDYSTGVLAPSGVIAPLASTRFKIAAVTLRSITGSVGTQRQVSTDDSLVLDNGDVVALPLSDGTITMTAAGISPNKPQVLANIQWEVVQNEADLTHGAPTLIPDPSDPLKATVYLDAQGSFNVICYYDANSNGEFDTGEQLKVFHLAEVAVNVKQGASVVGSDANYTQTNAGHFTVFGSGDFVSKFALRDMAEVQVVGGGADGMIGVSQIKTGWVQDGTTDTLRFYYKNGINTMEQLKDASFPILDSSYDEAINNAHPTAIFGISAHANDPATGQPNPNNPDPVSAVDPAGGQDRLDYDADSPGTSAATANSGHSLLISVNGANGFSTALSAVSTDFDKSFSGFATYSWTAIFSWQYNLTTSNWQNTGCTTAVSSLNILGSPSLLSTLGIVTSGPVYIHSIETVYQR